MVTTYELVEVPYHELNHLKDSLQRNIPDSITVYGFVDIYLRYGPLTKIKLKFYSTTDKKFKSFCCITSENFKGVSNLSAFWNLDEIEDADVGRLFLNLPNWNWDHPFVFLVSSYSLKLRFDSLIKEKLLHTNLVLAKDFEEETCEGTVMILSKEDYKEPKIKSGYIVKLLPASAASTLYSKWIYNFSETEEQLSERLSIVGGFGAFRTFPFMEDNARESLVSWAQLYTSGMIGMTYTEPEERRKGLAGAVILALAKKVMDEGGIAFAITEATNINSIKFHQSLGFKVVGTSGMSLYIPSGMSVKELL